MRYTEQLIEEVFEVKVGAFECAALGDLSHTDDGGVLSYIVSEKYLLDICSNSSIKAVFVNKELSEQIGNEVVKIVVDDPLWYYVSIRNYMANKIKYSPTVIGVNCDIHPSAVIANTGVKIGNNVTIGANTTIKEGVTLGNGCIIFPGAVLGADGFEYKITSKGVIAVKHDGQVILGNNVEIGANTFVAKGFAYKNTIIGNETKVDALVHYAHSVQCGSRCMIVANAMLGGHSIIGDDVWIGPSSTISNRIKIGSKAFIALGAVVVRNVSAGERVAGNFALQYGAFKKDWESKGGV